MAAFHSEADIRLNFPKGSANDPNRTFTDACFNHDSRGASMPKVRSMNGLFLTIAMVGCLWLANANASANCGSVDELVRHADSTDEQAEWAHSHFIDDGTPYGFDRARIIQIDFGTLIDAIAANFGNHRNDQTSPVRGESRRPSLVLGLTPLDDHTYYLLVEKVVTDTIHGYEFINLFGSVLLSPCAVETVTGSWRLHVSLGTKTGEGEITTSAFLVRLARVPDSSLIVAAEIAQDTLATFPPID